MTFYQELQLSSTGSKQLIRSTTDPKEKRRHILIYNFKVYLVMAFCVAVVSMYSKLTGSSNSVLVLLFCWQYLCCGRQISGSGQHMDCFPLQGSSVFLWQDPVWQI